MRTRKERGTLDGGRARLGSRSGLESLVRRGPISCETRRVHPFAIQSTYYAVVAQIIPVFLLILVVGQSRFQSRRPQFDGVFLGVVLAQVAVLLVGELCALRILLTGSETSFLRTMVAVSVALALAHVVMRFLLSLLIDFDPMADQLDRPPQHFWLVGVFGVATSLGTFAVLAIGT